MKTPLALVKEKFGDKAKLVAAVEKLAKDDLWLARTNQDKGLAHVSNAKLLRLHAILTEVKEKFGSREKLVAAVLELEKRTKDDGYKARLSKYPVPRLLDLFKSAQKRANAKSATAKKAEKPAAKPAAKKAEKPAAKTVEKPAAKPAKKKAAKA
jgi:hypothetical protein